MGIFLPRRRQSHSPLEADLFGDGGLRHVMGLIPRSGSHVVSQVSSKTCGLSRRCAKLPAGHGSSHVGHKPTEEGSMCRVDRKDVRPETLAYFDLGPRIINSHRHLSSHSYAATCHYAFAGAFDPRRSAPSIKP